MREVSVLSLDARQVEILAHEWAGKPRLSRAWSDIETLAIRFLHCDPKNADVTADSWHHLLMAVGNFKRSAGLISPAPLVGGPMNDRPDRIVIPGVPAAESEVIRWRSMTWRRLTAIGGLHVPTATTLLSALWPGYHVIVDSNAEHPIQCGAHDHGDELRLATDRRLHARWAQPVKITQYDVRGQPGQRRLG